MISKQTAKKFVEYLERNPHLSTVAEIADDRGVKQSSIDRYFRACKNHGLIEDKEKFLGNREELTIPDPVEDKIAEISGDDVPSSKGDEIKLDELEELIAEYGSKLQNLDSEQESVSYDISTNWFPVIGLSDLHIGHKNTDYDYINKLFDFVADHKRAHCFINGDLIENWVRASPNAGGWDETLPPKYQRKLARHKLGKIKDKILFLIEGNHEWRSAKQGEQPMLEAIAEDMNIPYLGHGGRINLNINGIKYKMHARHKFRYESSFNPCHACGRLNEQLDSEADLVAIGHKHTPNVENRFKAGKWRLYIRYGAALPSTNYEQYAGYAQTPLVAPTAMLSGEQKAMEGFKRLETVEQFLDRV